MQEVCGPRSGGPQTCTINSARPVAPLLGRLDARDRLDHYRFDRYVLVSRAIAGFYCGYRIDDVHPRIDTAEYRITIVAGLVIEKIVVGHIDEEL